MSKAPRWTEEQLAAFKARGKASASAPETSSGATRHVDKPKRKMNALEAAYAQLLDLRKAQGQVAWWGYECMRFRLADGAWFKPDFAVMMPTGRLEAHETKGFWREAARVRIKVAADLYPWRFVAVQRDAGGAWVFEEF